MRGSHALFRLFEETFGRQTLYGPPDTDEQERTDDALSEHIGKLKARVKRLPAKAVDLHYRNSNLRHGDTEPEATRASAARQRSSASAAVGRQFIAVSPSAAAQGNAVKILARQPLRLDARTSRAHRYWM
jgi:hypothetical protein